jgi:nitrous oxidase accessory protein NosD
MIRARAVVAVVVFFGIAASGGAQPSIPLSGTITSTLNLSSDARLVGDVTCMVAAGTPCIRITASGVTLRLNGFAITGPVDPVLGCGGGFTGTAHGIQVTGQRAVDIRGPGIVQQFRGAGIRIDGGSTRALVRQVTVSTNCTSGIWVAGGGDHDFEANAAVRNGNNTLPCGGI